MKVYNKKMSMNTMQRLSIPKKEKSCSRNCLVRSVTYLNESKADHSRCNLMGKFSTLSTNRLNTSTNNLNTSRKFVAPMALISKSTTFDRKFKSKLAQREAEYDKNLKSIKKNLFLNGNFNERENINPNRSNKFLVNKQISTSMSLNFKRSLYRDRSRSILSKKSNNLRNSIMKSTPNQDSFVTERSEVETNEEVSKYEDNFMNTQNSQIQENNHNYYIENTNENKDDDNCNHEEDNLIIKKDFQDFMKREEEIQIDFSQIQPIKNENLPINTLDLITIKDEENLLTELDEDKLYEIEMKDKIIFNNNNLIKNLSIGNMSISMNSLSKSLYSKTQSITQSLTNSISLSHYSRISNENKIHLENLIINPHNNFIQDNINKINLGMLTCNYENLKTNKENSVKFSREEYRKLLSTFLRFEYGKNILEELYREEEINENFLMNNDISERMRMRMIDWMIEVLSNYHCEDNTFFLSVNIMDRFFKYTDKKLKPEDLHLIGLVAMFISSKFYDVYPMKLKLMIEKVGHNKFTSEEIKNMEELMVKTLNYEILKPTSFEFVNYYFEEIFFFIENNFTITNEVLSGYFKHLFSSCGIEIKLDFMYYEKFKNTKKFTLNMLNILKHVVIYLTKMNCHDYNLISIKPSLLAAASIFVGVKICEQINNEEYINEYFTNKLCEISKQKEFDILYYAQKILYNAQNFDNIFTGLENLKKVHFNHILQLKETK